MPRQSPNKNDNRLPIEHFAHYAAHQYNGFAKDHGLPNLDRFNALRGYSSHIPRQVDRTQAAFHLAQGLEKTKANIRAREEAYLESCRNGRDIYEDYPSDQSQGCTLI